MWLMTGWSVGSYGVELQTLDVQTVLTRTDVAYLRTALGERAMATIPGIRHQARRLRKIRRETRKEMVEDICMAIRGHAEAEMNKE